MVVMVVGLAAAGALVAEGGPPSWSDYRLGQFISSRGPTPGDILDLDNNGDILIACRGGCTRAGLEAAGVPALESQIHLLRSWSLLREIEGGLEPAIPVLDRTASEVLLRRADQVAARLAEEITAGVAELVAHLEADGRGQSAFAVVFSQVLDSGVWAYFDELELIRRRNISRGGAPWGGEVWAYVSDRELEPHTSSMRRPGATVKVTWAEPLRPAVNDLLAGEHGLWTLFTEFLERGQPASAEVREKLTDYGVLGASGELDVVVIDLGLEDPLFALCDRLSTRVAETVIAQVNRPAMVAELGLDSEAQALVVAYHEIMWRLLERLVESGAVVLPRAIGDPAASERADLAALVVLNRMPATAAEGGTRDEVE